MSKNRAGMSDRRYTTDSNRRCERCGSAVSSRFVRVFGVGNTVYGCLECLTRQQLSVGKAAIRPDGGAETGAGTDETYTRWEHDGQ